MSTTKQTVDAYNIFSKQYSQHVESNDNFYNKCIEVPAMDNLLEGQIKGKHVLDLGCGSGLLTVKLKNWGAIPTGVDVSKEMINEAKRISPEIPYDVSDAESLPYQDSSYDLVVSSLVLHYMQDLNNVMREVKRVLKPGGIFIFSMHHPLFKNKTKIMVDGKKEYVLKPYFNNEQYEWTMFEGQMVVHSYHHNFGDIVGNLNRNDFVVNQLLEPKPIEGSKDVNPKEYEKASTFPTFVIFEARLNK